MKNAEALRLVILGIEGRMGQAIASLVVASDALELVSATTRPTSAIVGQDLGLFLGQAAWNKKVLAALPNSPSKDFENCVAIDFTNAHATCEHAKKAAALRLPLLVGTSGLGEIQIAALRDAAKEIPVLHAPNTSRGANLLHYLSSVAAHELPLTDIEICETHHRAKKDAPSGTALFLAAGMAKARGQDLSTCVSLAGAQRKGRDDFKIGIASLRGGSSKGEHSVYLLGEGESLELRHRVDDKLVFARGALEAAHFLAKQKPGFYSMMDMLGFKSF